MKTKIVLLMFLTLTLASCGTYQSSNDSEIDKMRERFIGRPRQEVIVNWGKPDEISSDGEGGEILTYRRYNGAFYWITNFYINSDKKVYWANVHRS
uniref:hypothetical protein n=1 Tax=Gelidibacter sp. TaxID=2018083 RepID=UPI00404B87A1